MEKIKHFLSHSNYDNLCFPIISNFYFEIKTVGFNRSLKQMKLLHLLHAKQNCFSKSIRIRTNSTVLQLFSVEHIMWCQSLWTASCNC